MSDELTARHQSPSRRPIRQPDRLDPESRRDLVQQVKAPRPELERTILSARRRLQAHASPATRYSLIGAATIRAELKSLGIRPLPCERTIERILQRNGLTQPRVRLAPLLPRQEYPGTQARASNQLHEVDLVGPIDL